MFLDGFGLAGYRSFGDELQLIGPLRKVNFLIGKNNCGKSNVTRFLSSHFATTAEVAKGKGKGKFSELDEHEGAPLKRIQFAFGIAPEKIMDYVETQPGGKDRMRRTGASCLERLLACDILARDTELAWFVYEGNSLNSPLALSRDLLPSLKSDDGPLTPAEWRATWQVVCRATGGHIDVWIGQLLAKISPVANVQFPAVHAVPPFRQVRKDGGNICDGTGIIEHLFKLQSPDSRNPAAREPFRKINSFFQTITSKGLARLTVPHSMDAILVEMDDKILPLESLGTGIEQLVILAVNATMVNDQIVCIDEPEIHQHPLLQKELVRYLAEETSNQYIIATHSAHILDTPDAAIFHFRHDGKSTTVSEAITASERSSICFDLGYVASDLLQTNCIIWVEGPSDRIYLRHWISESDSEMVEGIHYSIMFYGGRLLSHLSADDEEVDDFISLKKLNRFMIVMIDSDKKCEDDTINETKTRVVGEFGNDSGFAWVTAGRTIENYVPGDRLQDALIAVHPSASKLLGTDQYDDCTKFRPKKGGRGTKTVDKVKLARAVTAKSPSRDILDLNKQITRVVTFIRDANEMA